MPTPEAAGSRGSSSAVPADRSHPGPDPRYPCRSAVADAIARGAGRPCHAAVRHLNAAKLRANEKLAAAFLAEPRRARDLVSAQAKVTDVLVERPPLRSPTTFTRWPTPLRGRAHRGSGRGRLWSGRNGAAFRCRSLVPDPLESHPLGRGADRDHALHAVGLEAEGRPFQPHRGRLPAAGARRHHHPHRTSGESLRLRPCAFGCRTE